MLGTAVVSLAWLAASAHPGAVDRVPGLGVQARSTGNVAPPSIRVRSSDSRILALIEEGGRRSQTFRGLLDEIARSDAIVYIEFGNCAFGHLKGCLRPFVAATGGARYFRIVVTSEPAKVSHDQLIALIGHELRHAVEAIQDEHVVDVETMERMFRRIGIPLNGMSGFETTEARMAGDAVLAELSGTRK